MKNILGNLFAALMIGAMAIWGLGFGVKTMKPAPPNAKMYVDSEFKTYLTPPCAKALTWEHADFGTEVLEPTTMADIRVRQQSGEKLKPDEVCKNKGAGFYQTRALLPGLLGIGRDRWTPSGDWNW